MRPLEYRDHLHDLLKGSADVQQVQVPETGPYPYALDVVVADRDLRWQVIGQLADGAKHGDATMPVEGQPPVVVSAPSSSAPDAWLANVIGAAGPVDTERVEAWSVCGDKKAYGVTVFFRNGERVFLRLV